MATQRPPIPAEHRPALARLAELLLKHALGERDKQKESLTLQPGSPEDSSTVVKPPSS